MNDELFSDLILSRKTRDFDVLHLPAKAKEKRAIVESKPSPVEVNSST